VNHWLANSGEGYRLVVSRVKPEKSEKQEFIEELEKPVSWKNVKRKYPMYFWPELILEQFVKTAKKSHKERMRKILDKFDEKSELFEEVKILLKDDYVKGERKRNETQTIFKI
jgi:hypothetical protein